MKVNLDALTRSEEFVFKWQYRMLGDFGKALVDCFCLADGDNFERLRLAFPVEGEGMYNYLRVHGWWDAVERRAIVSEDEGE